MDLSKFQPLIVGISLIISEIKNKDREKFSNFDLKELVDIEKIDRPNW